MAAIKNTPNKNSYSLSAPTDDIALLATLGTMVDPEAV